MTDLYRFKTNNNNKFTLDEYLIIQHTLSRDEKDLMKDVVRYWERVDKEIEIREERLKRLCGEE